MRSCRRWSFSDSEQRLDLRRQVAVLQDELEQHADEIDRVLVGGRNVVLLGFARKLVHLLHQLELQRLHGLRCIGDRITRHRGRLALQDRQRAQKLRRREARRAGRVVAGRDAAVMAAREQIAELAVKLGLELGRGRIVVRGAGAAGERDAGLLRRERSHARARGRRNRTAALRHGVPDLRQHARANQLDVDLFVQRLEAGHHVAIEELVDDQLDLDVHRELFHREAERASEHRGTDRIVRVFDLAAADDDAETLVDLVERSLQPVLGLGDHARYRERFLELLIVDERKPAARLRRDIGLRRLELAFRELGEVFRRLILEQALDELALLAHLAHAVEELGLQCVRARALGEIEEGVVDVLKQRRDEAVDALLRNAANELQQIAQPIVCAGHGLALR